MGGLGVRFGLGGGFCAVGACLGFATGFEGVGFTGGLGLLLLEPPTKTLPLWALAGMIEQRPQQKIATARINAFNRLALCCIG